MSEENEDGLIKIKIRIVGSEKDHELVVPLDSTSESLLVHLKELCDKPYETLRIIFRGRVMKQGDTLQSLGVEDGYTMHVVPMAKKTPEKESSPPQPSQTNPPASAMQMPHSPTSLQRQHMGFPSGFRVRPQTELNEYRLKIVEIQRHCTDLSEELAQLCVDIEDSPAEILNDGLKQYTNDCEQKMQRMMYLTQELSNHKFVYNNNRMDVQEGDPFPEPPRPISNIIETETPQNDPLIDDILNDEEKQIVENDSQMLENYLQANQLSPIYRSTDIFNRIVNVLEEENID